MRRPRGLYAIGGGYPTNTWIPTRVGIRVPGVLAQVCSGVVVEIPVLAQNVRLLRSQNGGAYRSSGQSGVECK